MQRLLYICLFIAIHGCLSAQVVSGAWYGHADVDVAGLHNNYMTELVIKQKGTRVEGIFGYYFRDKYQSFFIHGRYDPKTKQITILNIPVIYYGSNSTVNSIDCNTNFVGVVIQSKQGSTVKGTFYHDERYKYMCPDLTVSYELDKTDNQPDSSGPTGLNAARIWKPQADDHVVDVAKTAPPATTSLAAQGTAAVDGQTAPSDPAKAPSDSLKANPPFPPLPKIDTGLASASPDSNKTILHTDSVQKDSATAAATTKTATTTATTTAATTTAATTTATVATTVKPDPPKPDPVNEDSIKIQHSFERRKAVLNQEYEIESDSIRLSFYDNGEIDGDSISVFVNGQLVLSHQGLEAKAFNLYLHLDSTRDVNEISMFAENLGRIPPNTALMVVTDGKNRYEVFMSSSLTENATIRLRRRRAPAP